LEHGEGQVARKSIEDGYAMTLAIRESEEVAN